MKKTFQFSYIQHDSLDKAPEDIRNLMIKAQEIREKAYAPYSKFMVGAAILDSEGNIYLGNNQENAAYPSGLCAERTAIFAAGANFPNVKIKAICITGTSLLKETNEPIPPCGACRQSLLEYENRQKDYIPVYFMGQKGEVICSPSIQNLLPFIFKEDSI